MSTFPIVLGESLFRVHLPVAVVLLGPVIGTMHLLLNLFASDLQTLGAILYTRLVLHKKAQRRSCETTPAQEGEVSFSRRKIVGGIQKAWPQLIRIIPVTVVAILIFTILTVYGVMDLIGIFFEPILGAIGLPGGAFQHVASVTVDGVVHAYDPAQTMLTVSTALGGVLSMDMVTG
ncbi:MAG TPA: nucleoside recognition protein, partial [Methanoregulaceae archaeon]|nr:nucleoside recognition protein [Methanoregulaceae archaeon]